MIEKQEPAVLSDTVVLVTGSAGNLGSAVIERFLTAGSKLILVDRHPDRLYDLYPHLSSSPDHLLLPDLDLLDFKRVAGAVEQAILKLGRIDLLIHTVGGFQMGEMVHQITAESWNHLMDINVKTFLNITRAVVPHMLNQKYGRVITISARPALAGKAHMGAYSAAKTSLLRLTESLNAELRSQGVSANCILPGTIYTPQNQQAMPNADRSKWVDPRSLAEVIYFLGTPAARDIQGAAIPVYGE
jgi:NAD(P)-dependent dehydrogenase (short-subunit alcohol dehydrogenase family)